jgi:excisionase family DNA binding protein
MKKTRATEDQRLGFRVEEIADRLGLSRSVVYEAVRTGQIRSVVLGKRARVIPASELVRLLGERPRGAA